MFTDDYQSPSKKPSIRESFSMNYYSTQTKNGSTVISKVTPPNYLLPKEPIYFAFSRNALVISTIVAIILTFLSFNWINIQLSDLILVRNLTGAKNSTQLKAMQISTFIFGVLHLVGRSLLSVFGLFVAKREWAIALYLYAALAAVQVIISWLMVKFFPLEGIPGLAWAFVAISAVVFAERVEKRDKKFVESKKSFINVSKENDSIVEMSDL